MRDNYGDLDYGDICGKVEWFGMLIKVESHWLWDSNYPASAIRKSHTLEDYDVSLVC